MDNNQIVRFSVKEVSSYDILEIYNLICELENEKLDYSSFEKTFAINLSDPNVYYYKAITDETIVGFISLHIQNILHHKRKTGEVQELIISPHCQGHGIGSMLMQKVENVARELRLEEIELTARIIRERAHVFYRQLGYVNTHYKFVKKIS